MKLKTACPECETSLSVNSDLVGRNAKCPRCGIKFVVTAVRTPTSGTSLAQAEEATETVSVGQGEPTVGSSSASAATVKSLGRFELQATLGQGGFGRVYRAYDPQLDRLLALKVPTFSSKDGNKARRFQSEAKAAAQLRHPNIVPTFESGKVGNQYFIASQFIDGQAMSEITKAGPTKAKLAAQWVSKIARALAYAHEMGIVHRDVKPHNVMLDKRGEPQLMDFGLAKRVNEDSAMTTEGSLLGTPAYMAPEQARGEMSSVGPHSDQYSVGAILYELLTGKRAFDGAPHTVLAKILTEEPVAPRSLIAEIPQDLEAITQKAMSKEISGRYVSCNELADDLDRWLTGDPTLARPMTNRERTIRWAKRNQSIAAVLGVVTIACVIVGLMGIALASYQAYASRQVSTAAARVQDEQKKTLEALKTATAERDRAEHQQKIASEAAEKNRRMAYNAHMNLGQQSWDEGGISYLHDLLERYLPQPGRTDLRSFEWYYWWRRSHAYEKKVDVLGGGVADMAYSSDGKTLAIACDDLVIRIWDTEKAEIRHTLKGHTSHIFCMAFSADNRTVASGGADQLVRLWDVETGQLRATLTGQGDEIAALRFTPDGRGLLTAGPAIKLWDLNSATVSLKVSSTNVRRFHNSHGTTVSIAPDCKTVAYGTDSGVILWDVNSSQSTNLVARAGAIVRAVAFSPDSKTLVSGGWDNMVRIWDLDSRQEKKQCPGHTNHVFDVAFSPDGKTFASSGRDLTLRIWDAASGTLVETLKGHSSRVSTLDYSPDSKTIASGGRDEAVVFWNQQAPQRAYMDLPHDAAVFSVAFARNGNVLASASSHKQTTGSSAVKLWSITETRELASLKHEGWVSVVVFSPDNTILATWSNDGNLRLWDPSTYQLLRTLSAQVGPSEICRCLCFSADGKSLAVGGAGGEVKIWDPREGTLRATFKGDGPTLSSAAFSPDGSFLVAGSFDHTVKVWRTSDGQRLHTLSGHKDYVWSVGVSADGRTIASASRDATVKLWDATTGEIRATLRGHTDTVQWLAFTNDGKTLATTGGDKTVKLWDVATGDLKSTLTGLTEYTYCVAFSPDDRTMATGSLDKTVRLWQTASDAEVQSQRSQILK
jgi:eukaryotic-like serine/threonine-protein kinase